MSDEPRTKRPTGLGRGLSSLLGEVSRETPVDGSSAVGDIRRIPVASIEPHPGQPRRIFQEEALAELAASIQARGVMNPADLERSVDHHRHANAAILKATGELPRNRAYLWPAIRNASTYFL